MIPVKNKVLYVLSINSNQSNYKTQKRTSIQKIKKIVDDIHFCGSYDYNIFNTLYQTSNNKNLAPTPVPVLIRLKKKKYQTPWVSKLHDL